MRPETSIRDRRQDWVIFLNHILGETNTVNLEDIAEDADTVSITWSHATYLQFIEAISNYSDGFNFTTSTDAAPAEELDHTPDLTPSHRQFDSPQDFFKAAFEDCFTRLNWDIDGETNDQGKLVVAIDEDLIEQSQANLNYLKKLLQKLPVDTVKHFLTGDIDSLPNLQKCPQLSGGLAPLAAYAEQIFQLNSEQKTLTINTTMLEVLMRSCLLPLTQCEPTGDKVTSTFNKYKLMKMIRENQGRDFILAQSAENPETHYPIVFPEATEVAPDKVYRFLFLLDKSISMQSGFDETKNQFQRFVNQVKTKVARPAEAVFYTFGQNVSAPINYDTQVFSQINADGPRTALYDAVDKALVNHLSAPCDGIFVFTDGEDTGSTIKDERLADKLKAANPQPQLMIVGCGNFNEQKMQELMQASGSPEAPIRVNDQTNWQQIFNNIDLLAVERLMLEIIQEGDTKQKPVQPDRPTPLQDVVINPNQTFKLGSFVYSLAEGMYSRLPSVSLFRPAAPEEAANTSTVEQAAQASSWRQTFSSVTSFFGKRIGWGSPNQDPAPAEESGLSNQ